MTPSGDAEPPDIGASSWASIYGTVEVELLTGIQGLHAPVHPLRGWPSDASAAPDAEFSCHDPATPATWATAADLVTIDWYALQPAVVWVDDYEPLAPLWAGLDAEIQRTNTVPSRWRGHPTGRHEPRAPWALTAPANDHHWISFDAPLLQFAPQTVRLILTMVRLGRDQLSDIRMLGFVD